MTSHGNDGDILQHIQVHVPPFNAVHRDWRGMVAAVEHHPKFDILTPSRRAPTEQRRQRRTLVETTTTTYCQA
jgi:hypothetical protein